MTHPGWEFTKEYPLWKAITGRRTRRIGLGTKQVRAGSLTYRSDFCRMFRARRY